MASGVAEINFGAFPGGSDASVFVSEPSIGASSRLEAWIEPAASPDHTADEHMVETIRAFGDRSSIVPGSGFTLRAFNTSTLNESDTAQAGETPSASGAEPHHPITYGVGQGTRIWGRWNVGWAST